MQLYYSFYSNEGIFTTFLICIQLLDYKDIPFQFAHRYAEVESAILTTLIPEEVCLSGGSHCLDLGTGSFVLFFSMMTIGDPLATALSNITICCSASV
mgnify:CR=1 FL=1